MAQAESTATTQGGAPPAQAAPPAHRSPRPALLAPATRPRATRQTLYTPYYHGLALRLRGTMEILRHNMLADNYKVSGISVATLAQQAMVCKRTMFRHLHELDRLGVIKIKLQRKRLHRAGRYFSIPSEYWIRKTPADKAREERREKHRSASAAPKEPPPAPKPPQAPPTPPRAPQGPGTNGHRAAPATTRDQDELTRLVRQLHPRPKGQGCGGARRRNAERRDAQARWRDQERRGGRWIGSGAAQKGPPVTARFARGPRPTAAGACTGSQPGGQAGSARPAFCCRAGAAQPP